MIDWTTLAGAVLSIPGFFQGGAHHGVRKLLKYVTKMNPFANNQVAMTAEKPENCENTPTRKRIRHRTAFTVKWSNTLEAGSWSTSGVSAPTILSDSGTVQLIKVTVPVPGGVTKRFVRLNVTKP